MLIPLLPTRAHGVIDYVFGLVAIVAPYLLGFADHGPAQWTMMAAGLIVLATSVLTDYEASLARIVPMRVHLGADAGIGIFLIASPWLFGFAGQTFGWHVALGLLSLGTSLVTTPHPAVSAERQEAKAGAPASVSNRTDLIRGALITIGGLAIAVAFGWIAIVDVVQQGARSPDELGAPRNWQLNFPFPHSPIQEALYSLHNLLFVISIGITLLVVVLVIYVCLRFRAARNPVPTRTTHNAPLEVAWTVLPVLILVFIAIPTFRNIRMIEGDPPSEMTLKVTGRQWFWDYAYPDQGGFSFSALMTPDDKLPPERRHLRLMTTDNVVVLPIDTVIRVELTGGDVIHAWGVPSLGMMRDAVPGRLNRSWIRIQREGFYYGACRELCGTNHAFMPITIEAVSKERFAAWAAEARQRFAVNADTRLAASSSQPNGHGR